MSKKSRESIALPLIRMKPPTWNKIFVNGQRQLGFTFDNIFIYNFYTLDERDKYSFENPNFSIGNVESSELNVKSKRIIRDFTGKVLNNNLLRKTRESIPSFINLKWQPPQGFNNANNRPDKDSISAFKIMAGLIDRDDPELSGGQLSESIRPVSQENFELQQNDFIDMTNEYLDMFAWSSGQIKNQYFAEEIDGTRDLERLEFVEERILDNSSKYKNAVWPTGNPGRPDRLRVDPDGNLGNLREKLIGESIQDFSFNSIVDVNDSSLLENLNFSRKEDMPSDIIITHNSDFSWNVAQASRASSGLLLGMQTRVRNGRFWVEYQNKYGEESDPSRRIRPLSEVVANTFPFSVIDISEVKARSIPRFHLVGFVIEKKQIIEPGEYAESEASREVKFPLIFIPCEENAFIPTNYLDAAINYDKEYEYHLRAVFVMTMDVSVLNDATGETQGKRLKFFVNSGFSRKLVVETREVTPPSFPRDLWAFHEYYTDEEGALALHWAFPVDRQRDTTYFAIFRRCSIYEPFQLLEIKDFNYSIRDPIRSAQEIKLAGLGRDRQPGENQYLPAGWIPEYDVLSKVKRLRPGEANTVYIDRDFIPNKEYIYAVCSIDAHGQISNYSSQIKVNLSVKPYKLEVRTVSPPGAPLIFPNYFIKSKMFLDVARSARYKKATLRFRPDYKKIKLDNSGTVKNIVNAISDNEINSYYLQIINPDRGKQVLLKYQIDDTINTVVDREERRRVAEQLGIPEEDIVL